MSYALNYKSINTLENSQKMRKLYHEPYCQCRPSSRFVIRLHAMSSCSNRNKDVAKLSMFFLCHSLSRNYSADKNVNIISKRT